MMKTGIVFDHRYADHSMGPYHIESPERVEVLNRMLEGETSVPFERVEPRPATETEIGWIHERGYIDFLKATAGQELVRLDPDTSAGPKTFETALLATGGFLQALDLIMEGRIRNAFACVRPPGHHAEASRAIGFCFFNNIAIGAEYLIRKHGLRRVLVVDWDVHHGNGTQHAFYLRPDVLYFSTHRVPFYPGTGAESEVGAGPGKGFNLNVPLMAGKGDPDFLYIFERILAPVASQFRPEFILVSAGFDIGAGDPLGGMCVTRAGFGALTDSVMRMAGVASHGRVAGVLEGGYDLRTLKDGVEEAIARLAAETPPSPPEPAVPQATLRELSPSLELFQHYWEL